MKKFSHVTKRFKNLDAVRDVTFTIKDKEVFGLWDPTSRGRLILTMATVFRAHGGEITVNGSSDSNQPERVKEQIGISFQDPKYDGILAAREILDWHAKVTVLN